MASLLAVLAAGCGGDGGGAGAAPGTLSVSLTGAPRLGRYSATLPIALVAQAAVAGKYTVEASATGYQTQSVSKDISAADAAQNFTLAP